MPGQEKQTLEKAYGHFANWATERHLFEALLDPEVHWIETDPELDARDYRGKAQVMDHLDHIQRLLDSASLVSVSLEPQGWQTRDNMQVHDHALHCCITDIDFQGDLIKKVVHCRGHVQVGTGPCG